MEETKEIKLTEIKSNENGTQQDKEVDNVSAFKAIKYKVVSFIDTHNYTSIAIGTGLLVGAFLLTKHFIKNR